MNWNKIEKNISFESYIFIVGLLQFIVVVFGVLSLSAVLYSIFDLVKAIKLVGFTTEVNIIVMKLSIIAIFSILCFYFLRVLREIEDKINNNNR